MNGSGLAARNGASLIWLWTASAALALTACAAMVDTAPAHLEAVAQAPAFIQMAHPATIELNTGYRRVLPEGGRWQQVGVLPQGRVFKPVDTVFSIEGRDVHEAYLVVKGNALQGFYLPR